jgi:hypothetical protein
VRVGEAWAKLPKIWPDAPRRVGELLPEWAQVLRAANKATGTGHYWASSWRDDQAFGSAAISQRVLDSTFPDPP